MIFRRLLRGAAWIAIVAILAAVANAAPRSGPQPATPQLQAFSGEYADPANRSDAYSVYVQDGELTVESDRQVPIELKPISATLFGLANSDATAAFRVDASGYANKVSFSDHPGTVYVRSGEPVRHVFHDYVRSEAMIPMRDGVKLHAVILRACRHHRRRCPS